MRVLLDTHAWLWWISEPARLRDATRDLIIDRHSEVYFSAASAMEIAIKYGLGRLSLPDPPDVFVPARLRRDRILPLPVQLQHSLRVASLPLHHRDPFDRLLVAQADLESLSLVTADSILAAYPVTIHPA